MDQYENRLTIATKVGGTSSAVLLVAVLAVAATDFSDDAPGWLRAATIVVFFVGVLAIGRSWAGFNWKAIQLRRALGSGGKKPKRKGKSSVKVGDWPRSYEFFWTLGLYALLVDVILLVVLAIWSVV